MFYYNMIQLFTALKLHMQPGGTGAALAGINQKITTCDAGEA